MASQEDGKTGSDRYLVGVSDHLNHHDHSSGVGYGVYRGDFRASTLPRQPKLISPGHQMPRHEDDSYIDSMRRNAYNTMGM